MKRITLTAYINANFEVGSKPSRTTVISWVKNGVIAGEQIGKPGKNGRRGGAWYVYPDLKPNQNQNVINLIAEFEAKAVDYEYGQTAQ